MISKEVANTLLSKDWWMYEKLVWCKSPYLCNYVLTLQLCSSSFSVHSLWLSTSVVKCSRFESLFVDVLIGQFYWTLKLTSQLKGIQETNNCERIANPSGQLRVRMCWICIQNRIISSHLPEQALTPTFQKEAVKSVSWLFTKYTRKRKHPTSLVSISGHLIFLEEAVSVFPYYMGKSIPRPPEVPTAGYKTFNIDIEHLIFNILTFKNPLDLEFLKVLKK